MSRRVFRRVRKSLKRPWLVFRPGGGRGAIWILLQMAVLLAIGEYLSLTLADFRWLLAICSYILFFSGLPTVILRHVVQASFRTAYLRGAVLLFFIFVGFSANVLQYVLQPKLMFESTFSAYHIINPLQTLGNWQTVEHMGWQYRPMILGAIGLLTYLELYRLGRREDKRAAAQI